MVKHNYQPRRSYRRPSRAGRGGKKKSLYEKPRIDPLLKKSFQQIGIPEPTPFQPDPFQIEALEKVKESDVLVTAPTGAGKTWIASQAIRHYISTGLRVWYTSPLKALSNSLYRDFSREFGHDSVGILTGERRENSGAPIIVGTTEILRNQLYDAMHEGISINTDLVILDEAHYLSDPDRGVVWEEVLIYLPSRVRLLLLSATVSNAGEVCSWLEKNRGRETHVVRSLERPVPLDMLFLFPDGLLAPLSGKKCLTPRVKKYLTSQSGRVGRRGSGKVTYGDIVKLLGRFDLLPAIFFLKSRKDCDLALLSCSSPARSRDRKECMKRDVDAFLKGYPHLREHRQMDRLKDCLVASHHAGQFPYWKILVETMMKKGNLDAIFSTSTVAAGVNFPARTVVLLQSDRYNGHEFSDLTAIDLHQMIGRAGRRGKDNIGFVLIIPGIHQDPQLICELQDSPPEPLVSRIHINFSMTLNLLLSHAPPEIKELLDLSFAHFQMERKGSKTGRLWKEKVDALSQMLPHGRCDIRDPLEVLDTIRKRADLLKKAGMPEGGLPHGEMIPHLQSGRLFRRKGKGVFALFHTYWDHGKLMCAAHDITRPVRSKKGRIRLKRFPCDSIRLLYDYRADSHKDCSLVELQNIFDTIDVATLGILDPGAPEKPEPEHGMEIVNERLKELPCHDCDHLRDCHGRKRKDLHRLLRDFRSLALGIESTGEGLWISFKRHLRFLKETGFVADSDRLTPDGVWASKLRLDQPLLIAEAIRKGGFRDLTPETMAGCIALFVWDRDQDVETRISERPDLEALRDAVDRVSGSMEDIRELKVSRGFDNPPLLVWPAMALFLWARKISWEQLLFHIPVSEGDMASLIIRTADHLRQVANLKETHPSLAVTAQEAIDLILREPVLIE